MRRRPGTKCWCSSSVARVGDAERERRQLAPECADEQRTRARVLGGVCQLPQHEVPAAEARSRGRAPTRSAKISAAHSDDRQPEAECGVRGRLHAPMVGSPRKTASTVREPGASPGRSRRCEGRCSPRPRHWPEAGKAAEREPRVRRPAPLRRSEPLAEGGFVCSTHSLLPVVVVARARRSGVRLAATVTSGSKARRRRSSAPTQPRVRRQRARGPRVGEHGAASSTTHVTSVVVRHYVSQIGRYAAAGLGRLGVQGERRLAAGGRRPGRTRRTATSCLWYWATFGADRRPADARAPAARRRQLLRRPVGTDAGRQPGAVGATLTVDGKRFRSREGRACIGRHSRASCARPPPAPFARTPVR